jgi:hydrogenase maturation protease
LRAIIGYGNTLRGEDGFGVEVIQQLQKYELKDTKLIELFQLTPELCLELLDVERIIFVDAYALKSHQYSLIVPISSYTDWNISHHFSPFTIIKMLETIYTHTPSYEIYSMATNSFDTIQNKIQYEDTINILVNHLSIHK